jgi:hypothetical protein
MIGARTTEEVARDAKHIHGRSLRVEDDTTGHTPDLRRAIARLAALAQLA